MPSSCKRFCLEMRSGRPRSTPSRWRGPSRGPRYPGTSTSTSTGANFCRCAAVSRAEFATTCTQLTGLPDPCRTAPACARQRHLPVRRRHQHVPARQCQQCQHRRQMRGRGSQHRTLLGWRAILTIARGGGGTSRMPGCCSPTLITLTRSMTARGLRGRCACSLLSRTDQSILSRTCRTLTVLLLCVPRQRMDGPRRRQDWGGGPPPQWAGGRSPGRMPWHPADKDYYSDPRVKNRGPIWPPTGLQFPIIFITMRHSILHCPTNSRRPRLLG